MGSINHTNIGMEMRTYLEGLGYVQSDVAAKLQITQGAVSAYYKGKPIGKNAAKKWSDAFGFRENWLLTGEGAMLKSTETRMPVEEEATSHNSLIEYLQRKIAELENKVDKLNDEKTELLQENAILRYENTLLDKSKRGSVCDAAGSLSADAI